MGADSTFLHSVHEFVYLYSFIFTEYLVGARLLFSLNSGKQTCMSHAFMESTVKWERCILLLTSNRINKDMSVGVMDTC